MLGTLSYSPTNLRPPIIPYSPNAYPNTNTDTSTGAGINASIDIDTQNHQADALNFVPYSAAPHYEQATHGQWLNDVNIVLSDSARTSTPNPFYTDDNHPMILELDQDYSMPTDSHAFDHTLGLQEGNEPISWHAGTRRYHPNLLVSTDSVSSDGEIESYQQKTLPHDNGTGFVEDGSHHQIAEEGTWTIQGYVHAVFYHAEDADV